MSGFEWFLLGVGIVALSALAASLAFIVGVDDPGAPR